MRGVETPISNAMGEFFERQLEECRCAFEAGESAALIDAQVLCSDPENPNPAPVWVLSAALSDNLQSFQHCSNRGRGRTANPLAKFRENLKHLERWNTVTWVREVQERDRRCGVEPRRYNLTGGPARELLEKGGSWPVAYRRASALLRGSFAQGSPAAMKSSYEIVQKANKTGSLRFYWPKTRTLWDLIEHPHRERE